jgi:hypothetical protein
MFRKSTLAVAVLAIGASAACSDSFLSPDTAGTTSKIEAPNTSAATPVAATAVVTVQASGASDWTLLTGYAWNKGNVTNDWCQEGTLYKPRSSGVTLTGLTGYWQQIGAIPHPQCKTAAQVSSETVTITFTLAANLAEAKSGNINLNFLTTYLDEETFSSASVKYHHKSSWTTGEGWLYATGSDGSTWELHFSGISMGGKGWFETKTITGIDAIEVNGAGREATATLTFTPLETKP